MPYALYRYAIQTLLCSCLLACLHPVHAALTFFEGPGAAQRWEGPGLPPLHTSPDVYHTKPGLELPLPMATATDRVYWDASLDLDLSPWQVMTLDIQIDAPAAVQRVAVYFQSGAGWYGGWFDVGGSHWQTITLAKTDFSPEGEVAGWDRIRRVRLAFWKQDPIPTTARIANFRATNVPILILRNTDARATLPQDAAFADRLVDRLQRWCSQYGLPTAIITDAELREAPPPPDTRVLILPYNPVLTNQIPQRLEAFTRTGGKLLAAYALNQQIAPLLEIERWEWHQANPRDAFALLHFAQGQPYGLPAYVAQDSWNIHQPFSPTARVLATWTDHQGTDSQIPAVTLASRGIFLGHVLTNTGRREKMQMLLGLLALLAPDLAPHLADALLQQATTLLEHPDWPHTRAFIVQTARDHQRLPQVAPLLEELDRDWQRLQQRRMSLSYPQAATHATHLAQKIQQAYQAARSPRYAAADEFRGVWAHDAAGIRGMTWDESMAAIKTAGMTDLFANVLWGGAAFYPSSVLPQVEEHRDYAREVTDAARTHGIRCHVWMVLWSLQHAPAAFVDTLRKQGRLQLDDQGHEIPWLCPSHPDNRDLTLRAATEIIKAYPFDGFHLDYIRYPDARTCFCEGCRQRFAAAHNLAIKAWPTAVTDGPHRAAWLDWRREQINSMVATLHQALKPDRPGLLLSAAVWPGWPAVRDTIGQDWPAWSQTGWIDFFTPMNYVASAEEAIRLYRTQREAVHPNVPVYPGLAPSTLNLSPATVLYHIDQLRQAGIPGFVLFDFDRDLLHQHLPALGAGTNP